jgi:hypothetical protein
LESPTRHQLDAGAPARGMKMLGGGSVRWTCPGLRDNVSSEPGAVQSQILRCPCSRSSSRPAASSWSTGLASASSAPAFAGSIHELGADAACRSRRRSGCLRSTSAETLAARPIHRSGGAEMRAARVLPSWHSGTARAYGRRWSEQTRRASPTVGRAWRLAVAPVVERRREWRPECLPGCRLSATLSEPTPRRLAISRARRHCRRDLFSRLHGCRLPHRQGADNELADARTLASDPCWRDRGARERARGYSAAPARAGSRLWLR